MLLFVELLSPVKASFNLKKSFSYKSPGDVADPDVVLLKKLLSDILPLKLKLLNLPDVFSLVKGDDISAHGNIILSSSKIGVKSEFILEPGNLNFLSNLSCIHLL